jgi:inositol-phosphate phosphatase / L-galactose 1-phosphate phosphatase
MDAIRAEFPAHRFIGEEETASLGQMPVLTDEPTWMIDPLDGTTNFVHKFPFVCTCIGLAVNKEVRCFFVLAPLCGQRQQCSDPREAVVRSTLLLCSGDGAQVRCVCLQVVVGVVYCPILEEMYTAQRGQGAFCNGESLSISSVTALDQALVATELGVTRDDETVDAIFDRISAVASASRSIRCTGSCAMNLVSVACGRLDGFYEIGFGGPWDVAAASIILTEAGGTVTDPAGGPFDVMSRRVLGGTPAVAEALAAIVGARKLSSKEPVVPGDAASWQCQPTCMQ